MSREEKAEVTRVPNGMIFPVSPAGPVKLDVVTLDGDRYVLLVGGVGPLSGADNKQYSSLTFKHERKILRMLYGRNFDAPEIPLSMGDLISGVNHTGRKYQQLRTIINELGHAWIHVVREGQPTRAVRLLNFETELTYRAGVDPTSSPEIGKEMNIEVRKLRRVIFAEEFWRACLNWQNCWPVRPDAIESMSSDVAACLYLKLAPFTHNPDRRAGDRMLKDARTALAEIGVKNADTMPMREVKRTFMRQRGKTLSVLRQMDYQPMWRDVFRVQPNLELNKSGTGYNIVYWRDADPTPQQSSDHMANFGKLHTIWMEVGLPSDDFIPAAREAWQKLEHYEVDGLLEVGYTLGASRPYIERVRSFIGPSRFGAVIGNVKLAHRENKIQDIGKYVGSAMREAFRDWAKAYKAGQENHQAKSRLP